MLVVLPLKMTSLGAAMAKAERQAVALRGEGWFLPLLLM